MQEHWDDGKTQCNSNIKATLALRDTPFDFVCICHCYAPVLCFGFGTLTPPPVVIPVVIGFIGSGRCLCINSFRGFTGLVDFFFKWVLLVALTVAIVCTDTRPLFILLHDSRRISWSCRSCRLVSFGGLASSGSGEAIGVACEERSIRIFAVC